MSNIDKIQGFSMLPKYNFLSEYRDLLQLTFGDPFYDLDAGHKEKDWENIPFVIPKCIVLLEKKLYALQSWCKLKDKDIELLLSNEIFNKLKSEMEQEKKNDLSQKKEIEKKFNDLEKKIEDMKRERETERKTKKQNENITTSYFDNFFKSKSNTHDIYEHEDFIVPKEIEVDEEYCKLRKYSVKQLRHIIYKIINKSELKYKVYDIEEKNKEFERRIFDLYVKRDNLDKKIDQNCKKLKEELDKENEKILEYLNEDITIKVEQQKKLIDNTLEEFEEIKKEIEENKGYREALNQKIDKFTNKSNSLFSSFETKLSILNVIL